MSRIEVKSERRRGRWRTPGGAGCGCGRRSWRWRTAHCSRCIVSNTNDHGTGSLCAAIIQANLDGGGDTIVFSNLFDTPQAITLTGGQLELTGTAGTTTIQGPVAYLLSVSGHQASRVFQVDTQVTASISGLTITGGSVGNNDGGGVQVMETAR